MKQWSLINQRAIKLNINLLIFSPFMFYPQHTYKKDFFYTFKLASQNSIDGLIISSGSLNVFYNKEKLYDLCYSYGKIPIVSIAEIFEGIPSIIIDNKQGMHDLIEHFIVKHGYNKIAFIRGPVKNQDADARFVAYKEVLEKHNIPLNKNLILQGDFGLHSGKRAVIELLDKRNEKPEAIIAANDDMIIGVLSELQTRKIKVPEDIAIGGFDDIDTVKDIEPSISSVRQPYEDQAIKAIETCISLINGKEIPGEIMLPAYPVFRESCGCSPKTRRNKGQSILEFNKVNIQKVKTLEYTEKGYETGYLSYFYTSIMNSLDFKTIYERMENLLPQIGIPSCYIAFYNKGSPLKQKDITFPPEKSEVVFSYKNKKRIHINRKDRKIKTLDLLQDITILNDHRRTMVCSGLIFHEWHYGYIIFELSPSTNPFVFDLLLLQLTSCLQSIYIHKELDEAFQKLKELDKAKTNLFSNISHEFRTPLTLIISPLESIINGNYGKTIKHTDEILQAMLRNGIRLLKLINNVLDFTKAEAGKMKLNKQKTDIAKLLIYYISTVESPAKNLGISIYFDNQAKNTVIANIDREQIEKAFFNVVSNALKFTQKCGRIDIILKSGKEDFSIIVKDTGIGISADQIDKIFDRFSQAEGSISRKRTGTGIGLAFTKEIIKLHKGDISAKSKPGEGSTFTVKLPYSLDEKTEKGLEEDIENFHEIKMNYLADIEKEERTEKENIGKATNETGNRREKNNFKELVIIKENRSNVLICDDNTDMRNYLHSLLKDEYNVITAKNGMEGLEKVKRFKPTLILSDVMMPIMNGYEFCNKIKTNPRFKHIPVVLITAKTEMSMRIEGFEYGADDYVAKPFNAQELLLRIKVFINREELRKELEEKNIILSEIAKKDSLTGLLNHAAILKQFYIEFKESKKQNYPLSVIMIDIDRFKDFNDKYGHQVGDKVIAEVANVLFKSTRSCDLKGRYGGDEFILILPQCGKKDINYLNKRIVNGIKSIVIKTEEGHLKVTISVGISVLDNNKKCDDPKELLETADKALYLAKERGRNQCCIFELIGAFSPDVKELSPATEISAI